MANLPFEIKELKILVADEHDLIRKSIVQIFSKLGCEEICEVSSGRSALKEINNQDFDLVVLNLYYSDTDGFALIDLVRNREIKSDIPVIVLSGDAEKEEIIKAIDKGATSYIILPFQSDELRNSALKALSAYFSPSQLTRKLRNIESLINSSQYSQAEVEIASLKDHENMIPALSYFEALIAKERGEVSLAISLLQKQINLFPEFLKNYRLLSSLYLEINDQDSALQVMESELTINPKNMMRQIKVAHLLTKTGRPAEAIIHLRKALLENNKDAEALFSMAIALSKNNNLEKALYYLKRYRRVYPKDSRPLKAIVQFCASAKKAKQAEIALRDEIKSHPERPDAPVFLAQFYASQEANEEAIAVLKRGIGHHPKNLRLYYELAVIHLKLGQTEAAGALFHRYRRLTKDLGSYTVQAQLYFDKKLYKQTLEIVHSAISFGYRNKKFLTLVSLATAHTAQVGRHYFIQRKIAMISSRDASEINRRCMKALQAFENTRLSQPTKTKGLTAS